MAHEPRSVYEFGDDRRPETVAEERRDHARAYARGERVADLTLAVVLGLVGHGLLRDPRAARPIVFQTLAELLYGDAAVDIPERIDANHGGDVHGA
jgi:hypothetical protein